MTQRWTDADIARKCRQNDAQAWRLLIGQHASAVYRLAVRMLHKSWEADKEKETIITPGTNPTRANGRALEKELVVALVQEEKYDL